MKKERFSIRSVRNPTSGMPGGSSAGLNAPGLLACGVLGIVSLFNAASADDFPHGCVSCHVVLEDGPDKRLAAVLDEIGHPALEDGLALVPHDCMSCHEKKDDTKFSVLIHQAHFGSPETNVFVQRFGGDCRSCHTMDGSSGEARTKEGGKNW